VWLVVRQGMALSLVGGAAGIVAALALGRTLAGLLYGVSPLDASAYGLATLVVLVSALAACWVPAHRAAVLDPSAGLRAQ
jgi:putative ABC transport system permease protein